MAYVSVSDWRPEQVTEWLKGLDTCVHAYLHLFAEHQVNGQQLLNLCPDELAHLGVYKIGHQELILEGVHHLRNFHYELDRENLQLLALRVSCAARSVHSEVRDIADDIVPTQVLSDIATVVNAVKSLVSWLDRSPFAGLLDYANYRKLFLDDSLKMVTTAHRERFCEKPINKIEYFSDKLAKLADSIIQEMSDPMILQPASLDLATLKKKAGEDLGLLLAPSFHGIHQVGDMKLSSPAHQSGKIEQGDEVVQVNYQTVVGWSRKKVLALFDESPSDLLLTLKRRPKHVKIYGQIYMKPYRLPSRKRAPAPYATGNTQTRTAWHNTKQSQISVVLTNKINNKESINNRNNNAFLAIPPAANQLQQLNSSSVISCSSTVVKEKEIEEKIVEMGEGENVGSRVVEGGSSSDEEFPPPHSTSPSSMRLYLPKPRPPIQRRFTISGPPRPSLQTEQFWRELQLERSLRNNQNTSHSENQINNNASSTSTTNCKTEKISSSSEEVKKSARSIIELNKVKRDAFFSDMGAKPFASSVATPPPFRGRLDKSRSTPAYDLNDLDPGRPPPPTTTATTPALNAIARVRDEACLPLEHGQMVNTINESLYQEEDDDDDEAFFSDMPPAPREMPPRVPRTRAPSPAVPPKPKPRLFFSPPLPPPRAAETVITTAQLKSPAHPIETYFSMKSPETPPSPVSPSIETKDTSKKVTKPLENIKLAMLALGAGLSSTSSPKVSRKKPTTTPTLHINALSTRRRMVSLRELNTIEMSGMLWQRSRKTAGGGCWRQRFFILTGPQFYGFSSSNANAHINNKALLFIHLPGFTCSSAPEVKSRTYAFKIYHTGTVFYFAADSPEQLQMWLEAVAYSSTVGIAPDDGNSVIGWSEDEESDLSESEEAGQPDEEDSEDLTNQNADPVKHQSKLLDSPRKFSSLKKLSLQRQKSTKCAPKENIGSSLDRKYLKYKFRLLSSHNKSSTPVPVPTSQFRSYRRQNTIPISLPVPSTNSNNNTSSSATPSTATAAASLTTGQSIPVTVERRLIATGIWQEQQPPPPPPPPSNRGTLQRRAFHSSNPSLINPEMADYRMTQERLREFRNLRNQQSHMGHHHHQQEQQQQHLESLMTLEQFMTSRQQDDRLLRPSPRHQNQQQPYHSPMSRVHPSQSSDSIMTGCGAESGTGPRRRKISPPSAPTPIPKPRSILPPPTTSLSDEGLSSMSQTSKVSLSSSSGFGLSNSSTESGHLLPATSTPEISASTATGTVLPDYPGIEYPPAFEPETYTLQFMLKNRKKQQQRYGPP